jgi:GNAT superfamily N-acetyltransferase
MATGKPLHIVEEKRRSRAVDKRLRAGLIAYNASKVGAPRYTRLVLSARDAKGRIVGGLAGDLYWNALYVELLWLEEGARHSGVGTRLMREAERRARGARKELIYLNTYTFQAPDFYPRLGFREIGRIPGYPRGGTRIFLVKRLRPSGSGQGRRRKP